MKLNSVALTLATAGSLVAAQGHKGHAHRHHQKRDVLTTVDDTVIKYVMDGQSLSAAEVCKGIKAGYYKYADAAPAVDACASLSSTTSSTTTQAPTPTVAPAEFVETSSSSTVAPPSTSSSSTPASTSAPASSSSSSSSSSSATGLDASFPDGEIDCGTFPSDYGAVALDYLGLGGWSGIQYVSWLDDLISDIVTAVTGESCHDGAMCSYACPPGYQKSQWPTTQGSTGQSVGGLQCKNGKLYKTNPDLSDKLCIAGVGGVNAQNNVGETIAICRTDYPGTESETIPLGLGHSELQPLTCPDGETYYKWQGKTTSAQYYVNPKGVSTEKGCQWGDGSEAIGNWAPINLGVGQNNGKWLSIFQNSPTTNQKLDYSVEIKGDNLSGSCKYDATKQKFISESGENDSGCTVQVLSGSATYVFY
ncbi:predicted protein [Aspergillus terreus NIH2624]|uniref:SUN domain protein (Uth1) n=1 Tax=Aspergillus terreus (strain NIH 2624 / FGSC A1156) TaxID=341663 RepID=Q0CIU5_ASPTN|nr:uncharacterized protein ATEG_06389 [Aspergillus terreus NIH2624]EAU32933.1 predicted protein [Aspergillus terreus NIH2624]